MNDQKSIAVIGSGPAGLMTADVLATAGVKVTLFEKRKGPAWKLYVAGSSGLNITNELDLELFASHYTGPSEFWKQCLSEFSPQDWIRFIETKLGLGTFLGTSGRYFVETMHAAKLIRQWRKRLETLGVEFRLDHECVDFQVQAEGVQVQFAGRASQVFDSVCFALGGGSWETSETSLSWPEIFSSKGVGFQPFQASNTGYELAWSEKFLSEAEGKPLKNVKLTSSRGERRGDLIITSYGLEGTPIYFLGEVGTLYLDLKPDLSEEQVFQKLSRTSENFSPLRRSKKLLSLCSASQALLFHMTSADQVQDLKSLAHTVKNFPLKLTQARPLSESISSQGGILWSDLDEHFMLRKFPGVYCLGEMVDWDAPTGGFLIQACVSQGAWVASRLGRN